MASTSSTASWRPNIQISVPMGETLHPDHNPMFKHCMCVHVCIYIYIYLCIFHVHVHRIIYTILEQDGINYTQVFENVIDKLLKFLKMLTYVIRLFS